LDILMVVSASVDIGEVNLAIYIAELADGELCSLESDIVCVRADDDLKPKKKLLSREGFKNVIKFLHSKLDLLLLCDEVIIEQQIEGRYRRASSNVRIEQHVQAYFDTINLVYGKSIDIIIASPSEKYTQWNGPKGQSRSIRKRWAVDKAIDLLGCYGKLSNEKKFIRFLQTRADAEHVSDCIVQLMARHKRRGYIS
jgi:hypothetical protein